MDVVESGCAYLPHRHGLLGMRNNPDACRRAFVERQEQCIQALGNTKERTLTPRLSDDGATLRRQDTIWTRPLLDGGGDDHEQACHGRTAAKKTGRATGRAARRRREASSETGPLIRWVKLAAVRVSSRLKSGWPFQPTAAEPPAAGAHSRPGCLSGRRPGPPASPGDHRPSCLIIPPSRRRPPADSLLSLVPTLSISHAPRSRPSFSTTVQFSIAGGVPLITSSRRAQPLNSVRARCSKFFAENQGPFSWLALTAIAPDLRTFPSIPSFDRRRSTFSWP